MQNMRVVLPQQREMLRKRPSGIDRDRAADGRRTSGVWLLGFWRFAGLGERCLQAWDRPHDNGVGSMLYLTNSFSVHMIPKMNCGEWEDIKFKRISSQEACTLLKDKVFKSYFGHVDTAKHLERRWRIHIPVSRGMVEFRKGDSMIIATVSSKRAWEHDGRTCSGPGFQFYLVEYRWVTKIANWSPSDADAGGKR